MLNLIVRSVFDVGQELFLRSDFLQQFISSSFLSLVSVLLVGVGFLIIVLFWRRRQRGPLSTLSAVFNNTEITLDEVLQTSTFRLKGKRIKPEPSKKKRKDREQLNGHPAAQLERSATESNVAPCVASPDKPIRPKKKKREMENVVESLVLLSNNLLAYEEKSEDEEAGQWERKMSSRGKRQLRKKQMKKECAKGCSGEQPLTPAYRDGRVNPAEHKGPISAATRGSPEGRVAGGSWNETVRSQEPGSALRRAVEWAPPGSLEEDIFSHVGTWDLKDVRPEPVTFGTVLDVCSQFDNSSAQPSPSLEEWHTQMTSLGVEVSWLGEVDHFDSDQTSDWKPPREEWGNWGGDEGALGQQEVKVVQGQGVCRKPRMEARRLLQSCENAAIQGLFQTVSADDSDAKKDRRKKRKMRKTT